MAEIGKAEIRVIPTFAGFASALRVIAKHCEACAAELETLGGDNE